MLNKPSQVQVYFVSPDNYPQQMPLNRLITCNPSSQPMLNKPSQVQVYFVSPNNCPPQMPLNRLNTCNDRH